MNNLKNYYRKIERSYLKKCFIEDYAKNKKVSISWAYKLLSYGKLRKEYEEFKSKNK